MCDQIADAILDAHLRKDKSSRVACEVMAIGKVIIVGGEITSEEKVDIPASVTYIAPSAFNYNNIREFVVSDDNEYSIADNEYYRDNSVDCSFDSAYR